MDSAASGYGDAFSPVVFDIATWPAYGVAFPMPITNRLLVTLVSIAVAGVARAQAPVRLPGVQITATMEKPHAHAIIGVARDTAAVPIEGVEVSIVDLKRRVFAGADGKFRFDDIRPGEYSVRARKVGYAPQVRTVTVDEDGGISEFALLPIAQSLQPMVVSVGRGGLGGIVGDTAFNALKGAVVRLLGAGRMVATDSSGLFFFDVHPGKYFVGVKQPGFVDKTLMVRVPKDSGKYVALYLEPRNGKINPRSVYNMEDLAARMASRTATNSMVYSSEDLESMGVVWIGDALQNAVTRSAPRPYVVDTDCYAVLNGGPEIVNIKDLTREDIVSMEVYPIGAGGSPPVVGVQKSSYTRWPRKTGTAITGLTNTKEAGEANFYGGKRCPLIYVWKK
jgi:hypothetical protein